LAKNEYRSAPDAAMPPGGSNQSTSSTRARSLSVKVTLSRQSAADGNPPPTIAPAIAQPIAHAANRRRRFRMPPRSTSRGLSLHPVAALGRRYGVTELRPQGSDKEIEVEMEIEVETRSNRHWIAAALSALALLARIATAFAIATLLLIGYARAALIEGTERSDLLFAADDDNLQNPLLQPAGAPNQTLNNTDVMEGFGGDDVMIGLLGGDVMRGGKGNDVLVGGTEQGTQPNSDIMYGDDGRDVAIWRGGDGSDVFIGGRGIDALVMGAIDRDAHNVPVISPATGRYEATGLPTADVTGQGGFCTLEDVRGGDLGYEFLVRFFLKPTGALAVTMRVSGVEQVFCTSQTAAAITFADLRDQSPAFVEVSLDKVAELNDTVRQIIR
jgi:hypothetical protein